jgi:multidrug efflux pump subunit AcrA (membrane-fusion protein)
MVPRRWLMFNKNKKHKKNSEQKKGLKAGLIVVLIIVLVLGVIVANYKYNQTKAYVELVSAMNYPYAMSGASYEGNISDDATQNIYLTSGEKIAEVYVSKGDSVVKGDQLFQYDTQALQSAVDEATLGVEAAQNTLANEKTRLEKYNAIVPVTE